MVDYGDFSDDSSSPVDPGVPEDLEVPDYFGSYTEDDSALDEDDIYDEEDLPEPLPSRDLDASEMSMDSQEGLSEGIANEVTSYTFTDLEYPNLVIQDISRLNMEYQIATLKSMLTPSGLKQNISIYARHNDGLMYMGKIADTQLKPFINLAGRDNVIGHYDSETELKADLLFVLSP